LSYTQPSVSRQLVALEREVGVRLVERSARHVALTPAGEALLEHAEVLLPALDAAVRHMQLFRDPDGGIVRLGALPSAIADLVPRALRRMHAEGARVDFRLHEGWSETLAAAVARDDTILPRSRPRR